MEPMLCESATIFDDDAYEFEVKWDGERAILFIAQGRVKIQNRRGKDITFRYPELQKLGGALENKNFGRVVDMESKDAIIDGEIIMLDDAGNSDFQALGSRSHLEKRFDIELRSALAPVTFVAFDLLSLEGQDLTQEPLSKRRLILAKEFPSNGRLKLSEALKGKGPDLFRIAQNKNWEGLVAKRLDSPYVNRRSPYWLKIKNEKTEDITVTGYTVNNAGLRLHNDTGFGVQCAGAQSQGVKEIIDRQGYAIIEVKYLNRTKANKLRMPTFKGVKG